MFNLNDAPRQLAGKHLSLFEVAAHGTRQTVIELCGIPESCLGLTIYHELAESGDPGIEIICRTSLSDSEVEKLLDPSGKRVEIVRGIHTFRSDPYRILLLGGLIYFEPYSTEPLDQIAPIRMHFGEIKSARERYASDELFRNCPNHLPIVIRFTGQLFDAPLTAHWIDAGTGKSVSLAWYENEQALSRAQEHRTRVHTPAADEHYEWGKTLLVHSQDDPR